MCAESQFQGEPRAAAVRDPLRRRGPLGVALLATVLCFGSALHAQVSIEMVKTVGAEAGVCATTEMLEVLPGTEVHYCYQLHNVGQVSLEMHDLEDDQLGAIFSGLLSPLPPGDTLTVLTSGVTITDDVTNIATWTAAPAVGDPAAVQASATVTVIPPLIEMVKTVGTEAGVCATTEMLEVLPGTDVYYCYQLHNVGQVPLEMHDLDDDQLGAVFSGLVSPLPPGETLTVTTSGVTITEDVTNVATWTASPSVGESAMAQASATVTLIPPSIELVKTVGVDPDTCATTSTIEVLPGTMVYYCFTLHNTGPRTLELHDLEDDQLGPILAGFAYSLAPGATVDTVASGLTVAQQIDTTTRNVATWTAYTEPVGGSGMRMSVDSVSEAVVVIAAPAPAPTMSWSGILLGIALLLLIAGLRLPTTGRGSW